MNPERFQQIERLYHSTLEREPVERAAYLREACAGDDDLRREVESLLSSQEPSKNFIEGLAGKEAARLFVTSSDHPARIGDLEILSLLGKVGEPNSPPFWPPGGASSVSAPEAGEVIGDYEILEKIGGNMGIVFKARHRLLDKVVALKLLPADGSADSARLARFQRELRVMGQLQHANLVAASDARIEGRWHLVAMELIEGLDLERLVEAQGPFPVAAACEAARQAALGLEHAHQRGLIHRDIKPSNLMLTPTGTIKVIDLGLALIKGEINARLTQAGLVMGTVSYCAPEQFRDASHVDIRADIYSLGCTIFHLLVGKPPYGEKTTIAEVMQAQLNEPFPMVVEERPDVPPGLKKVLARMTAKDPAGRFASPGEAAEALRPFAEGSDLQSLFSQRAERALTQAVGSRGNRADILSPCLEKDSERRRTGAAELADALAPFAVAAAKAAAPIAGPRRRDRIPRAVTAPDRPKRRRVRIVGVALAIFLVIVGAVFLATKIWEGLPVVVLMDTTAAGGVYDKATRDSGGTNADVLSVILSDLPIRPPVKEAISSTWEREAYIEDLRPHLVVIHRSAFFHALNAEFGFEKPLSADKAPKSKWQLLYEFADDKLIEFIVHVGKWVPRTKFLVYSRGTDERWLELHFRDEWVAKIEQRFPELKGRIKCMLIEGGVAAASFTNPEVAGKIKDLVKEMLGLSESAR